MPVVAFVVTLLLDVRAHIPNQPGLVPDPENSSIGTPLMWAIAAVFVAIAFVSAVLWLAPRLAIGLL
jgi:hypothetical protein